MKKKSVVNMAPSTVSTTLHFLLNLRMGSISYSVTLYSAKRLSSDKHSSLLGALVSCEEKKMSALEMTQEEVKKIKM